MAPLLYRLGQTAYRRWPLFIAAWLVSLIGLASVAATLSQPMSNSFSIPGIASEEAADLQDALFPQTSGGGPLVTATVVVAAPQGHRLDEPTYHAQLHDLVTALRELPQLSAASMPAEPIARAAALRDQMTGAARAVGTPRAQAEQNAATLSPLSADGRVGLISWSFDVDTPADVAPATQTAVRDAIAQARSAGLQVEANGTALQAPQSGSTAELLGMAVALIVLLVTFGSLVAAGLPLVTSLLGVMLGMTGITAMTAFTDVSSSTTGLATMIGLAVGVDYALFILGRYRFEIDALGGKITDPKVRVEAIGRAVATAGSAVTFAGLTVLIALLALAVVQIPFLTAMGLGAAATVLVAVLVALTLLPAVLGMLKSKAFAGQLLRNRARANPPRPRPNHGARWAVALRRRPAAVAATVVVLLGALALPVLGLHLSLPSDDTAPADTSRRQAADLIAEAFGPGRQSPFLLVVDARDVHHAERRAALDDVVSWAAAHTDVANAQVVATNAAGTGAQILITPASGADDPATEDLLRSLRRDEQQLEDTTGVIVGVTGLTALNSDVSDRLKDALPIYLAVVVALAFMLLTVVFRSLLVPLTATVGFLLSVLATLGATVAVFQGGMFGLTEPQPLVSFMPVFLIGVVFGLAMDYQVFLVTRIREAHVHGATAREAVISGFSNSARVVAAAALIMIAVFAAFMLSDEPILKSMGFALAAAVFFDAFVVRMTLMPALLFLLGEKAWWLPRWLQRVIPTVDIEGDSLQTNADLGSAPDLSPAEDARVEVGAEDPVLVGR